MLPFYSLVILIQGNSFCDYIYIVYFLCDLYIKNLINLILLEDHHFDLEFTFRQTLLGSVEKLKTKSEKDLLEVTNESV